MADAILEAEVRTAGGKGPAGRLRREGLVPAVVYGLGEESLPVTVSARELGHLLAGEAGANTLITLKVDGKSQLTLARQIQRNPVKGTYVHVDFIRVRADQAIQAEVPIHLTGNAEGVSRGGVLEQMVHTLSIEAKPGDLPNVIEIDISALEIGGDVRVGELTVPAGVTVLQDAEELVAHISAPRVQEEAGEGAEGEAGEGAGEGGGEAPAASSDSE
jgi:large subunit ribosomal protein L25